jgi:hypothetical protein
VVRKAYIIVVLLAIMFLAIQSSSSIFDEPETSLPTKQEHYKEICGAIKKGDTLFDIFKKYKLDLGELFKLQKASSDIYKLGDLFPLNITRTGSGFNAVKMAVNYEKRIHHLGGGNKRQPHLIHGRR